MFNIGSMLQQAMGLIQSGQYQSGEKLCHDVLRLHKNQPDALHFLAMSAAKKGATSEAESYFKKSLKANPAQPAVLSNMGNMFGDVGRLRDAMAAYRKAVQYAPDFVNAWHNLVLVLNELGLYKEAVDAAENLTRLASGSADAWELLGISAAHAADFPRAFQAYENALKIAPSNARIWFNYGGALQEDVAFTHAIDAFRKALSLGLRSPEIYKSLAAACYEAHEQDQALEAYDEAIGQFPLDADLHYVRAKFRWEAGDEAGHMQLLQTTLEEHPENAALWGSYIDLLGHQGAYEKIATSLAKARSHCGDTPRFQLAEAIAQSATGNVEAASRVFEGILEKDSLSRSPTMSFVEHLLRAGDYARAETLCAEVVARDPYDQGALAFLGTAWELMDDPRSTELLDYEKMVRPLEIPCPNGFSDRVEYFEMVRQELDELHQMQAHPLDQSLRGGTQTNGFLFRLKNPVLQQLQDQILMVFNDEVTRFEVAKKHPFWGRNTGAVAFKGAWSVKLRAQGFHTNHFHGEGWISSALYINLPDVVQDSATNEGHIQFGVPPVELKLPLGPKRIVRPVVGTLAMFPSYMWHGTIPFDSDQPRMTIAYDLVPSSAH